MADTSMNNVPTSEEELRSLMGQPAYWRDRDPAIVKQVTEGFKNLYPGEVVTSVSDQGAGFIKSGV